MLRASIYASGHGAQGCSHELACVMTVVSPEPPSSAANVIDLDLSTGRRSMIPCEPIED